MHSTRPAPLESRLAGWVLRQDLIQDFSFRTVGLLLAIERGDSDIDAADARQLLQLALKACITAEILAGREVRP